MKDKTMSRANQQNATEPAPSSDALIRLIYRSHSLLPGAGLAAQQDGLANLLLVARANNAALNVTGALVLYDDYFAQVLEGPEAAVTRLFDKIKADSRHDHVTLDQSQPTATRLFGRWAMAIVAEHHEPDMPLVATTGGLSQGAPWRVSAEQEQVLSRLRDLTRGYGRGS
jgi:hypothetical protein